MVTITPEKQHMNTRGLAIPIRGRYYNIYKDYRLHSHYFYEIEIILAGRGANLLNGERHPISRGSVCILTPTDNHSILVDEKLTIYNINIDERYMTDKHLGVLAGMKGRSIFTIDEVLLQKVSILSEMLAYECYTPGGGCSAELVTCIFAMLLGPMEQPSLASNTLGSMRKAVAYINEHYRENPSLTDVAREAGFNPTYFSELFKRTFGESFTSRLNSLKVGYAKALLCQGMSVSLVGELSGFGSSTSFFTTFKQFTGKSPREFKKMCEGDNK